jgi:two-component system cell cycle sensor histidine kinase/response regulator CckA
MSDALRVLLVEDSVSDAKLVLEALRGTERTVEFERVETSEAMRAALARATWDLVVSDWSMPKFSGLNALEVLRESEIEIPFIIVSGTIGEETAVEAMRAGADDYVLKDRLARLVPAIEREVREYEDRRGRRVVENALRESEARFRRLSDSGIIGIALADLGGSIVSSNDAYLQMVGYSHEEVAAGAVRWAEMMPPDFVSVAERMNAQLRTSGVAPAAEMEVFCKDGSRLPVLVGAAMVEQSQCIVFIADLSERKRAEEGRAKAEEALRQSDAQLRQAQKMEAVGRLAGGVAHDFNNILSVILSYAEVLMADLKPADPIYADMEEIQSAALRAAGLTRQLLMFSRHQAVETRVLDLHDVVKDLDKMLRRLVGEDVELVLVAKRGVGRVRADPSHIEQVIVNLVVNARDAMPTGGILTLETANVVLDEAYALSHLPAKSGPHVLLAVSDTGTGMDRETQARIFEPFFTTKEKGKGTGLGLSTVFGIVQQSGGNIWVYSEPGKGTTFKIYLPQVDAEVDPLKSQAAPATLRGTETVLLVEDEAQVRAVVLRILNQHGYRVLEAANAGEALLLCEKHPKPIDLLLTDVVMPKMSGPELARRLTATQPSMRVLCMSGYTDDSAVRYGVVDAGVAYVQKPITPASLGAKIREVLDGPRVGEAS